MSGEIRSSGRLPITKRARKQAKALATLPEYVSRREIHVDQAAVPSAEPMAETTLSTPFGSRLPRYRRKVARKGSGRWTQ